jgi:hypothetical protein
MLSSPWKAYGNSPGPAPRIEGEFTGENMIKIRLGDR